MSIDEFFFRRFNPQTYNCTHFTAEVWAQLTGDDLAHKLGRLLTDALDVRQLTRGIVRNFSRLDAPVDPCLIVMQRARSAPHIGVYVRGKVLHIHDRGVEYQPVDVASRCFQTVTFFR